MTQFRVMLTAAFCCTLGASAPAQSVPEAATPKPPETAATNAPVPAPQPAAKPPAKKPAAPPAKQLFGAAITAAPLAARAIGFYALGCLAGARPLAVDGPAWQVMRLSRNRNWAHPELVKLIETLAGSAKQNDGWSGLLVGDLSQPRGGPMLTGHASHQVGLDADIWLTPMPDRRLSKQEREDLSATSMLAADKLSVDPQVWTPAHVKLLQRAASYPQVDRIFVHPAIKKALCETPVTDRSWLGKVRPYWGHHYHFHVRIACPKDSPNCRPQPALTNDDGCGKELSDWLALLAKPPKPDPADRRRRLVTLDQLPAECRAVLNAGTATLPKTTAPQSPETSSAAAPAEQK
jgi:penicillin-insensitive murein DD-endopeptidase